MEQLCPGVSRVLDRKHSEQTLDPTEGFCNDDTGFGLTADWGPGGSAAKGGFTQMAKTARGFLALAFSLTFTVALAVPAAPAHATPIFTVASVINSGGSPPSSAAPTPTRWPPPSASRCSMRREHP